MIIVYVILCIAGTVLPYSQLIPEIIEGTYSFNGMINDWFATRMTRLNAYDLMITAMTFIVFAARESWKNKKWHLWLSLAATFMVGASLGFPLFLLLREMEMRKNKKLSV